VRLMRVVISTLVVGLIMACTSGSAGQVATPSPQTYEQLAARPLKLPVVAAGQACPASAITLLGGTAPRVGTSVRFGFGIRADGSMWPSGSYAFNKTVWDFSGPPWLRDVLLRGSRLDGDGKLFFGGNGITSGAGAGITVIDSKGGVVPFYPRLRLPVDSNAAFYLYPTAAGCFAIQADSDAFSEVVVFRAV